MYFKYWKILFILVPIRGGQNQIAIWLNQIQSPFFGLGDLIWFDFGDTLISADFDLIRFSKIFFHAWFDLIWFWKPCWFSQNQTKSHKIMKVNFTKYLCIDRLFKLLSHFHILAILIIYTGNEFAQGWIYICSIHNRNIIILCKHLR